MEDNKANPQENTRKCPKDCTKCNFMQHAYCSAQMSFYLIEKVDQLEAQLNGIQTQLNGIQSDVQPKEVEQPELINPLDKK